VVLRVSREESVRDGVFSFHGPARIRGVIRPSGRSSRVLAAAVTALLLGTAPGGLEAQEAPGAAPAAADLIRPAVIQPMAPKSLILDADKAGDRLVAVGERGHILLSDDNGATWRQVPSPADSALTAVHFVDARHGWAVGHDSVILATADGGDTWTLQHAAPDWEQPLMDVLFTDERNGVAVGAYGLYMETTDGGTTWADRRILESDEGLDYHYNAILAPGGDVRVIAGEAGTIAISLDRGATWTQIEGPYDGSFFDALVLSPDTWLVYGLQGHVFRTEDAGRTWTEVPSHTTAGLMGGAKLTDGRVVLVGLQGVVLTSTDQGRSFRLDQRGDRVALAEAIQAADGRLILLGEQGAIPVAPAPASGSPAAAAATNR